MKKCSILTSLGAQLVKNLPAIQETQVQSVGQKDPLEKGMATHSSILTWKIPWTEEPGGLLSIGSHRVRQDWATNTLTFSSAVVTTDMWLTELLICGSYSLRNWIFSEFYLILINSNLCRHLWPLATVFRLQNLKQSHMSNGRTDWEVNNPEKNTQGAKMTTVFNLWSAVSWKRD